MFIDDSILKQYWEKLEETPYDIKQLLYSYRLVVEFFSGDKEKATLWFETANPMFGGLIPIEMFRKGRGHKVVKFIELAIEENIV